MRRSAWRVVFLVFACAVVAGCASMRTVDSDSVRSSQGSRNLIASADLRTVETGNVFEAIRRLKPRWLNNRGQSVFVSPGREGLRVYLDGMFHGDEAILKRMSVRTVEEIRFLSAREATLRYGTGHSDGALDIFTRRGFARR